MKKILLIFILLFILSFYIINKNNKEEFKEKQLFFSNIKNDNSNEDKLKLENDFLYIHCFSHKKDYPLCIKEINKTLDLSNIFYEKEHIDFYSYILFKWDLYLYNYFKEQWFDFFKIKEDKSFFWATYLHNRVQWWNLEIIKDLIENKEVKNNINKLDRIWWTALDISFEYCRLDIFNFLLEKGAKFDKNKIFINWDRYSDILTKSLIYNRITAVQKEQCDQILTK